MKDAVSTGPEWTQDEAINYECARECITNLMGIFSTAIDDEASSSSPDLTKIEDMLKFRNALAHERMALRLEDRDRIDEIRLVYGARVRAYREASQR